MLGLQLLGLLMGLELLGLLMLGLQLFGLLLGPPLLGPLMHRLLLGVLLGLLLGPLLLGLLLLGLLQGILLGLLLLGLMLLGLLLLEILLGLLLGPARRATGRISRPHRGLGRTDRDGLTRRVGLRRKRGRGRRQIGDRESRSRTGGGRASETSEDRGGVPDKGSTGLLLGLLPNRGLRGGAITAGVENGDLDKPDASPRARHPVPEVGDLNGEAGGTECDLANPDTVISASLNPEEGTPVDVKARFPKDAKGAVYGMAPNRDLGAGKGVQVEGGKKGASSGSGDKLRPRGNSRGGAELSFPLLTFSPSFGSM